MLVFLQLVRGLPATYKCADKVASRREQRVSAWPPYYQALLLPAARALQLAAAAAAAAPTRAPGPQQVLLVVGFQLDCAAIEKF